MSERLDRAAVLLELSQPEEAASLASQHVAAHPHDARGLCLLALGLVDTPDARGPRWLQRSRASSRRWL